MSAEIAIDVKAARLNQKKARKGVAEHVREALCALASGKGQILSHAQQPWASITFSGARHTLALVFEGPVAVLAGEAFIADLPDHEFSIPGQLVADADIRSVNHTVLPEPKLEVRIELLLLQDA